MIAQRIAAVTFIITFVTPTTAGDLLMRSGFEACGPQSVDKSVLSSLIVAAVNDAPACIPAVTTENFTYCYSTICADGTAGCPTILHGGQAAHLPSTNRFDAISTLDSVSGKMAILGTECDFAIQTNNITLNYTVDYSNFSADGNNGATPGTLNVLNVSAIGMGDLDYSVSGPPICNLPAFPLTLYSNMLAKVQPSVESALQPTLDYAWCPFPF